MSMDDLIARFRAEQRAACRICGGNAPEGKPYCLRHFRMLRGNAEQLMEAAAAGERLDEADATILLHQEFSGKYANWIDGVLHVGPFMTLRMSGDRWVLRTVRKVGGEAEIGRYASVREACAEIVKQRQDRSMHSPYAVKRLIR